MDLVMDLLVDLLMDLFVDLVEDLVVVNLVLDLMIWDLVNGGGHTGVAGGEVRCGLVRVGLVG